MKGVIAFVLSAVVLVLAFSFPVLADDSETVTITMTGVCAISISLDRTQWPLGDVAPDQIHKTVPEIEWATLTVTGNCDVKTLIVGEDATWVDDPSAYRWTLSDDGSNGEDTYGLWFRIAQDTTRGPHEDGYVPITKTKQEFWPYDGGESLTADSSKKFGLMLLTPSKLIGGRQMQTQVTIIAVAPLIDP